MFLPGFHIAMGGLGGFEGEAETEAWIAEVVSNGGTVSDTRAAIVDDLIVGLKTDGIWTKLDRLWLFAAENTQSALTDLVGLSLATNVNSTTFTADQGYTGNGSNMYIDSNFSPTSGTPNYAQNDASMFAWCTTSGTSTGAICAGGGTEHIRLFPRYSDGQVYWCFNNASTTMGVSAGGTAAGLWVMNRTASNSVTLDRDGTQMQFSGINPSATPDAAEFTVLKSGSEYGTQQCVCFGCGGALTAGERVDIYSRLQTYMTAIAGVEEFETAQWIMSVYANGGTVSTGRRALVDALVTGLKADGVWTKLDRLYLFAAENTQSALVDIVSGALATNVNSVSFTADEGYTGNGSTSYIDTNLNPLSPGGGNYSQDACSMGAWVNTNTGGNGYVMGGDGRTYLDVDDGNITYFGIQNSAAGSFAFSTSDSVGLGLYAVNRSGVSASQAYINGAQVQTDAGTSQVSGTWTWHFCVWRHWDGWSNRQISGGFIGGNLSSTEHDNLYDRLQTYMTAVGL